jgi:long-chain acyl-CoA synthetase
MPRTYVAGAEPVPVDPADNLTSTLWRQASANGSQPILRYPRDGGWASVTWAEFAERVRRVAGGLVALGIQPGDRVALMSSTRVDWTLADYAILAAGAVSVPIYETSSVAQCEWILSDSGAKAAFAGSSDHAKNLDAASWTTAGSTLWRSAARISTERPSTSGPPRSRARTSPR